MTYVLSLCDKTGNMVRPWAEAGWRCVTVDIDGPAGEVEPGRYAVRGDVRDQIWSKPAIVFAFPPCTHLASSGARHFQRKGLAALIEALQLVEACRKICEDSEAPWMLENPVGTLSTYWRKPDYTFHPCHYGHTEADAYTKKTCLWTGGGFVMPDRKPVEPTLGDMIHRMPPSADRSDKRSATPSGFARAVFEANACRLSLAA